MALTKRKITYNGQNTGNSGYHVQGNQGGKPQQSNLQQTNQGGKIPGQQSGSPQQGNLSMVGGNGGNNAIARPPYTMGGNGSNTIARPPMTVTGSGVGSGGGAGSGGGNAGSGSLNGVSANTQQQLMNYSTYKPGEGVSAAQQQLDAILGQKPGDYTSRYDGQIQDLMGRISNGEKFDYNINDDQLFKYYSDLYQDRGRQAMQDAMGQAAAMTGGYGNSFAQSAGQQAYQQQLGELYDVGLDMRDRAYQQWQDEQTALQNQLAMLQDAESIDYGRHRDTVGDWRQDVDYATGRLDTAAGQDWDQFLAGQNFWQGQQQLENSDYWTGENFNQAENHFQQQMAQDQNQFDANMAYNYANLEQNQNQFEAQMAANDAQTAWQYVQAILANGQMPSAALLAQAGLSQADVQAMIAQAAAAGGGTGGGPSGNQNQQNGNLWDALYILDNAAGAAGAVYGTQASTPEYQAVANWWNNLGKPQDPNRLNPY